MKKMRCACGKDLGTPKKCMGLQGKTLKNMSSKKRWMNGRR